MRPNNSFKPSPLRGLGPTDSQRAGRLNSGVSHHMRQILISIVGTAVGAAIFFLVVLLATLGYDAYKVEQRAQPDSSMVTHPPGLTIPRHSRVTDVDKYSVVGVLENSGSSAWYAPRVVIDVSAAGKSVGECETTVYGKILPGEKHPFLISCNETSSDLPFQVTYTIDVREGRRADG